VHTSRLTTVVVRVHDVGRGVDGLGHLMHVPDIRQSGADVEELVDPRLRREVPDGTAEERPVFPDGDLDRGPDRECTGRRLTVGGVVVLAAQMLITYWAGNHTCGPERGHVMSA